MLSLSGKLLRADGNYPYTLHNGTLKTREHRANTDVHQRQGEMNLFHSFADSSRLALKASYYASRRGLPAVVAARVLRRKALNDEDFLFQASYQRLLSKTFAGLRARLLSPLWDKLP